MKHVIELPDSKTAVVSTENRYRIVLHKVDGTRETVRELQRIESAMTYVQSFNSGWKPGRVWAEIVDYETAFERQEREAYYEDVNDAVERRLAAIEAAKPQPKLLGRLLARAAALIW